MMIFVFGMNWNPLEKTEEQYLTTIKIPAKDHIEASQKLIALIGQRAALRCWLNDCYKY